MAVSQYSICTSLKKITSSKVFLCDCDLKQVKGVVSLKKNCSFFVIKKHFGKVRPRQRSHYISQYVSTAHGCLRNAAAG